MSRPIYFIHSWPVESLLREIFREKSLFMGGVKAGEGPKSQVATIKFTVSYVFNMVNLPILPEKKYFVFQSISENLFFF